MQGFGIRCSSPGSSVVICFFLVPETSGKPLD